MPLLACPFCRELFEEGEHEACPVCGVALASFDKLRPLHVSDDGVPLAPEDEPLPFTFERRGRGALVILSLLGLAMFFAPWIHLTLPEEMDLSGFDLARRLGWSWGAAVAWVVMVPTVLSRRTLAQMRGARVAAAFLALVPGVTAAIFYLRPPHGGLVPVRFTFAWCIGAELAISLIASVVALRFGGRIDDLRVTRGSSEGHLVH